ncbi:MAG TPA: hypothetical protein VFQ53_38430 [Kofleriaceae bacterium]|nr:hypothetical protein [Kofleriaceae bacterium]
MTALPPAALASALKLFTAGFVVADKRDQIVKRLATRERRDETLGTLARWITGITAPLAGADQSPAGLRARFGELVGIYLDDAGAQRMSIADALVAGRGKRSLFVSDNGRLAMLTSDAAPTLLCQR